MTMTRRIISQSGIQLAGKLAGIAFGVAAIAIITRALGLAGYGKYATIMAYLQLFGVAVDLGLNVLAPSELGRLSSSSSRASDSSSFVISSEYSSREISAAERGFSATASDSLGRNDERAVLLSNIFTMRLTVAVVVFAAAAAVAFVIPVYDPVVRVGIAAATFSFLGIVLHQILLAPFQVAQRMVWPAIADVAGRALLTAGVAFAAWRGMGILPMVWATVIGNVAMFAITFIAAQRIVRVRLAFDFPLWKRILTKSWPVALSIIFNLVYLRADTVILSFVRPEEEVGIYAAPYRLLDVVTQFPHLVMGLVLPLLAAAWATGDRAAFRHRLQRVFDGLAFLGFPLAAGALALGTPIMAFVAGSDFAVSGPILGVLSLALLGIFLGQPFGYAIVALERQRAMLWGYAAVAAVTLIGYFVFIPRYSYWGAAWMTVASEIAIAVATFAVVRRTSAVRLDLRIPVAALLASGLMALAVLAVPAWHIIPRVALGVIAYGAAVLLIPWTRRMVVAFRAS
ncbi:MAG: flippase [bacterium]|nr:flippase [bacterium]